ncbi:hypothetical protein E2C01_080427 [Portunus trituberculatus]|uniref:Uncharacterized protein n=1 Tax=Portunus trituberculatus TaxID=210409 RepID=A0A5B7IT85_PORTR|nr:hypothetical protein [Portunus trituberculatus]
MAPGMEFPRPCRVRLHPLFRVRGNPPPFTFSAPSLYLRLQPHPSQAETRGDSEFLCYRWRRPEEETGGRLAFSRCCR